LQGSSKYTARELPSHYEVKHIPSPLKGERVRVRGHRETGCVFNAPCTKGPSKGRREWIVASCGLKAWPVRNP